MDQIVVGKLLERYGHLHPLILARSTERARSLGELFDFLDGCPDQMPLAWNDRERRWVTTGLLLTKKS